MEKPSFWRSKRYFVAFVLFLNFTIFQILRNNINIAVLDMTVSGTAGVDFDPTTLGLTLSAAAYGGLFSFLGGFMVDHFGGATTGTLCLFAAGAMTLLHPIALHVDYRLFWICRFLMGMFESFFYASSGDVSVRWFPKDERPGLISLSFNGLNVGTAIVYPICGYTAYTWGWEMVFYVTGTISLIASGLSFIVIQNRPSEDKFISKKELQYILERTEDVDNVHPYRSILTSKPIWCLCAITFSYMWISSVIGNCMPLYIQDLTKKNTNEIGLISFIPNLIFVFAVPLSEKILNYWKSRSSYTTTRIHKITIIFACISTTISLAVIVIISNFIVSIIGFVCLEIETAFLISIIFMVPVYLHAPSASFVYSLILVFFSISALLSQTVTVAMVPNHTQSEWNECFWLSSIILLTSAAIFAAGGSSECQSWSTQPPHEVPVENTETHV